MNWSSLRNKNELPELFPEITRPVPNPEQIENGGPIPSEFADLAEIHPQDCPEVSDEAEEPNAVFSGEIFFPNLLMKSSVELLIKSDPLTACWCRDLLGPESLIPSLISFVIFLQPGIVR